MTKRELEAAGRALPPWKTPDAGEGRRRREPDPSWGRPEEIARCLSCSMPVCRGNCFGPKYQRKTPPPPLEDVRRLNGEGYNDHEIARLLGRPRSTVYYWRRQIGLEAPEKRNQKEG